MIFFTIFLSFIYSPAALLSTALFLSPPDSHVDSVASRRAGKDQNDFVNRNSLVRLAIEGRTERATHVDAIDDLASRAETGPFARAEMFASV